MIVFSQVGKNNLIIVLFFSCSGTILLLLLLLFIFIPARVWVGSGRFRVPLELGLSVLKINSCILGLHQISTGPFEDPYLGGLQQC